jgi:hypothetical protein
MALMHIAGLDHRRMLTTADPAEADIEAAVAQRTLELRADHEAARDENLAIRIANAIVKSQGG